MGMRRFAWEQLRHRPSRSLTLGVGILVAAVSFTLLTSAVSTGQIMVKRVVAKNWETAYDILVRPPSSFTPMERQQGLVSDNYLSGIFGGITIAQYHAIAALPDVEVAAPIANLGYILPIIRVPIVINRFLTKDASQVYRLRMIWRASANSSQYEGTTLYVYYTRAHRFVRRDGAPAELVPGTSRPLNVCNGFSSRATGSLISPFDRSERDTAYLDCYSSRSPALARFNSGQSHLPPGQVGVMADASVPILLAAIDPIQEARLVGIDGTIASGRYLSEDDQTQLVASGSSGTPLNIRTVPVLASTRSYVDESLEVAVERLRTRSGTSVARTLATARAFHFLSRAPGDQVGTLRFPISSIYQQGVRQFGAPSSLPDVNSYWSVSTIDYGLESGRAFAEATQNPDSVWHSSAFPGGFFPAPPGSEDTQFRRLVPHPVSNLIRSGTPDEPALHVVGQFDPDRLPGFSPLSQVPLETYYPPIAQPASAASIRALGGRPLLPTLNIGGYIAQPPLMLTTLKAMSSFVNPRFFQGANPKAPISVIRVRVAHVIGPDDFSRDRVRRVALAIHQRTGLAVDITAGSSPKPILIQLPAGGFGRPPLLIREGWVKKGVAVSFLRALDRKSLLLFILILLVCGFFLGNGALASVRARRAEMGILSCLGWSRGCIFRAVLGELALIGLAAGVIGSVLTALLVLALSYDMPTLSTALVTPVAVGLAVGAGLVPAWRATRVAPLDAVRAAVAGPSSVRPVRSIWSMALNNLRRLPGRAAIGAGSLVIGVGALAALLSINLSFQGVLAGTLLGRFISVQVRGVDYVSVAFAIGLGGLSVADVLALNMRERSAELATLRSCGWDDSALARLVAYEGLALGILGSMTGATLGTSLAAALGQPPARIALSLVLSSSAGIAVAFAASVGPAVLASRRALPMVLAEE